MIFNEGVTTLQIVGTIIILFGVYITNRKWKKSKTKKRIAFAILFSKSIQKFIRNLYL
jgi:drug/metabolite transporter (DMT)-like permease